MMFFLYVLLMAPPAPQAAEAGSSEVEKLIREIAASGAVLQFAIDSSERVDPTPDIAPGEPPLLAFRYLDGQSKHRFGELDLVMDDAGH